MFNSDYVSIPDVPKSQLLVAIAATQVSSATIGTAPVANQNLPATPSLPVVILAEVGVYMRQSVAGTCLADGTDTWIPPNVMYHTDIIQGYKIGINGPNAGNVHITVG